MYSKNHYEIKNSFSVIQKKTKKNIVPKYNNTCLIWNLKLSIQDVLFIYYYIQVIFNDTKKIK